MSTFSFKPVNSKTSQKIGSLQASSTGTTETYKLLTNLWTELNWSVPNLLHNQLPCPACQKCPKMPVGIGKPEYSLRVGRGWVHSIVIKWWWAFTWFLF